MSSRGTQYTEELGQLILEHIENGETVASIARMDGMPSAGVLRSWRNAQGKNLAGDYPKRFEAALQVRLESFVDDLIQLPRDAEIDHPGALQRVKLECDNRRWLLSKMLPNQFGDHAKLEIDLPKVNSFDVMLEAKTLFKILGPEAVQELRRQVHREFQGLIEKGEAGKNMWEIVYRDLRGKLETQWASDEDERDPSDRSQLDVDVRYRGRH